MRPMHRRSPALARARRHRRQKGYVGILMAFLAVPMFAMAAFAADVGFWYTDAAKLQRAADAAALAGVIWMPDAGKATTEANKVLLQNGISTTDPKYTIQIQNPTSERLRVTITNNNAGRLFSQVLDSSNVVIIRTSLAEYIKPIPLGSPNPIYGNDPTTSTNPQFWASIGNPYYSIRGGDPYASKCTDVTPVGNTCAFVNTNYRPTGYFYGIEIPAGNAGRTVTVSLFDAGNYGLPDNALRTSPSNPNPTDVLDSGNPGRASFQVLDEDLTPLNYEDNPGITWGAAGVTNGPGVSPVSGKACWAIIPDGTAYGTWGDKWNNVCSFPVLSNNATVYPLQVRTSNIPSYADAGSGLNNFSIRVGVASGTGTPRVYAVGQMPVFANPAPACASNETNFFLAEIPNQAAGKRINLSLYDPGDVSQPGYPGNFLFDILVPNNAGFGGTDQTEPCSAVVAGELAPACTVFAPRGSAPSNVTTGCSVQVKWDGAAGVYNGEWVDINIDVPGTYDCQSTGQGCWWKLRYRFTNIASGITDRTTYVVRVSGDPVRVIS